METSVGGFAILMQYLRTGLFYLGAIAAVVCLVDWLVRTRRINPFNPVARFMRSTIDPLMVPIERRIVRAGGMPTSAPWWTLVFIVVVSIVVISLLDWLGSQLLMAGAFAQRGPAGLAALLVRWTFGLLQLALIVRIVSSWFGASPYSPWIRWSYRLTDPILQPLRQIVPTIGFIDITPIIAWLLLSLLERLILSLLLGG